MAQDYVTQMESLYKHLNSTVGAHMRTLDKTLSKTGKKPIVTKRHKLLSYASSPLSATGILSSLLGSIGAVASGSGQQGNSDAAMSSGSDFPNLSQGQIWADAATAINRAMKRNL